MKDTVAVYAAELSSRLAKYEASVATLRGLSVSDPRYVAGVNLSGVLERGRDLATAALAASDQPSEFFRKFATFRGYDTGLRTSALLEGQGLERLGIAQLLRGEELLSIPALHKIPDVLFTFGSTYIFGGGSDAGAAEVSTNLLGDAAGSAFGVLGSDDLKDYFKDNLTVGTGFPLKRRNKLTATLGVGIGGISAGRFSFWPAINIEQTDSGDVRVPRSAIAKNATASNWSSPLLSVAVSFWSLKELRDRLDQGKLSPVGVIGLRFPYYYPNDPFSALAALFSSKRSDFIDAGSVQFQLGLFFPLQKVKPVTSRALGAR